MKQATILNGIGFAIIASISGGILITLLSLVFSTLDSMAMAISTLSLAYIVYLLRYSNARQGKVVVPACWAIINLFVYLFDMGLITHIAIQISFVWAVRSLYFHSSIITILLDLLLTVMSTGAGAWALAQTGSLIAAAWCFFLCQSLFCAIPKLNQSRNTAEVRETDIDRFDTAHKVAQDAVRKLSLN